MDSSIPLKNNYVVELIRSVVLWTVWLERNKLCFATHKSKFVEMMGMQIISITRHWSSKSGPNNMLKLSIILP
jgi:hypothetical protein